MVRRTKLWKIQTSLTLNYKSHSGEQLCSDFSTLNTTPDTTPCYLLIPKLSPSSVILLVIMARLSMLTLPLLLCSLTTEAQYQCNPDSAGLRQDMLVESSV